MEIAPGNFLSFTTKGNLSKKLVAKLNRSLPDTRLEKLSKLVSKLLSLSLSLSVCVCVIPLEGWSSKLLSLSLSLWEHGLIH
ncbi:hypothetical protein [Mycoplasmoides pneumoniae]|uniref:hypothetical protein n=1 Tax=Mycoplasmoides pneumoniae TaxID=2104 RepID=UPI0013309811|nr:hypothetical protein [Mycoplasmoides pneumoniae]